MKALLSRIPLWAGLLVLLATVAACSMQSTSTSSGPPYTVTYKNTTPGTTGSVPVDTTQYASGATVTVMGNTGNLNWGLSFTFTGWDTADSGSDGGGGGGTFYAPGSTFTIMSNVTLYGTWNP